jgi:D-aminopeptidase
VVGAPPLANFGERSQLRIDGLPVGRLLGDAPAGPRTPAGSCIAVLAVAAPLPAAQLERVARRAVFEAAVDATAEAVLDALWSATTMTGRGGFTVPALPHDRVLELLAAHGRLDR